MDTNEFAVLKLFVIGILEFPIKIPTGKKKSWRPDAAADDSVPTELILNWHAVSQGTCINAWMMRGISATDSFNIEPTTPRPRKACNESRLQWEVEVCGEDFKRDMGHVDPQNWCNLTHFISEYHLFTLCTETKSHIVHCYWPNPLVESYIIRIHKHFFSNCTMEQVVWVDPPDDTLTILILIPVFLTLAMIALVVWCSKRSDILA